MTTNNNQPIEDQLEFSDEPVLLMSPKVIHGRPRPRLRCIDRGEVQGILTEGTSSAWKVGKVVGYVPIEKSRETLTRRASSPIGTASPCMCWDRYCGWRSGRLFLSRW